MEWNDHWCLVKNLRPCHNDHESNYTHAAEEICNNYGSQTKHPFNNKYPPNWIPRKLSIEEAFAYML